MFRVLVNQILTEQDKKMTGSLSRHRHRARMIRGEKLVHENESSSSITWLASCIEKKAVGSR